jgi:branched-chain amino acid transport system substrate-binding protein
MLTGGLCVRGVGIAGCIRGWARTLGIALCASLSFLPRADATEDIVLGVIAGLSGNGASYGAGIRQGAEMAVREINDAGGIGGKQVRLLIVDDASDPTRSAIAMRRLVSRSPDLIVGGWGSAQVLAHLDFPEESAVPYIVVGATNPRITSAANRWVFRVIPSDSVMAKQLAHLAVGKLGLQRIAVINDNNAYGNGNRDIFIETLEALGQKAVEVQSYNTNDSDMRAQLQRIRAARPDAIAVFGTFPAAPAIMRQAREIGIAARFLGTGGLANDALIRAGPMAAAGTILMSFFSEEADAEARAWSQAYRRAYAASRFNGPELAAWEYRAIMHIAAPCLRSAGHNRVALRDCIASRRVKTFGIEGEAHFDATGQLVQPVLAVEVREGAFQPFRATP